jgi:uncharacterized protein (DUF1501 family)
MEMIMRGLPSLSRRRFLSAATALAAGAALPGMLFAKTGGTARLVVVILRGALDGLAAVPSHGDPAYENLRRDLAIAAPGAENGALELDALFGLHPSLGFVHESFRSGEAIVFHAAASPYRERSHFDGQNVLESGRDRPLASADGWLNRALNNLPARNATGRVERAAAISQNVPLILRGDTLVLSKSPLPTPDVDEELLARLADLYSNDDWFSARLSEGLQGEKMMAGGEASRNPVAADRLGMVAQMAATVMRSENGPEIAVFEATGWDTHANQGGAKGLLAQRLQGLDRALRSLAEELSPLWPQTAVLVVTEFGRTAAMNGTRGTDHGTGGCAFLLGGAVRGGRVVADWPGLAAQSLLDNRDLRPTLDLRSVFKGVLDEHLHIDANALNTHVFPDSREARPLQGLMRA